MNLTEVTKTALTDAELRNHTLQVLNPYKVEKAESLRRVTVPQFLLTPLRFEPMDLMRGFALVLMMLSHCMKGLLTWDQFPSWGLVPLHLITKFSSSLFIFTFGLTLAVAYLPHVGTTHWPRKRLNLFWRSLEIMFWYKLLTVVQMFQNYRAQDILDALLFKTFPDYVEVLGFYSLALLWLPFFLPVWKRSHIILKIMWIGLMVLAQNYLSHNIAWDSLNLKALLVEHNGYFTFGQFTRGPLILLGLLFGELIYESRRDHWLLFFIGLHLIVIGSLCLGLHFGLYKSNYWQTLYALAKNAGKHPPSLSFVLFSLGGALNLSGLCLVGGKTLSRFLYPVTLLGKYSLEIFVFHIAIIFIVYRYLLNYYHRVDYFTALSLTGLLFVLSILWAGIIRWRRSLN